MLTEHGADFLRGRCSSACRQCGGSGNGRGRSRGPGTLLLVFVYI